MVNWNELKNLRIVAKFEEILAKWYGVDVLFVDSYCKVKSSHFEKNYKIGSNFLKNQLDLKNGIKYLIEDINKAFAQIQQENKHLLDGETLEVNCFFPYVKMIASKIVMDGQFMGFILAYPYLSDSISNYQIEEIKKKIKEEGVENTSIVDQLKKMSLIEMEYLREFMELLTHEIVTYHSEIVKREEKILDLNKELGNKFSYHNMIGKSKPIQEIYNLLDKISKSDSSVFIQGANGTGKELVAKAIHYNSSRKDNTFLAINCSAFNDNLLDSELFGHVKGSFTGAIKDKKGVFETTHGGTLFLDEIGDTSLSMQVKLLRVLQEGTFLPVGANTPRKTDVRIVAATNKDIQKMMMKEEFREDLFYRVNVINVKLPSLRERSEDINLLIDYFLKKQCDELGRPLKTIAKKCLEKMFDYSWPGNIRELENEIERLVVLSGDEKIIHAHLLNQRILDEETKSPVIGQKQGINISGSLKTASRELEFLMIKEGLRRCNFNKSKLAKELEISRASLIMKVDKYGLDHRKKAVGEG